MHKGKRERFKELCELAEVQEDPKKLGKIAEEIDSILASELVRLKKIPPKNTKPVIGRGLKEELR
jgi:hypothetical protein